MKALVLAEKPSVARELARVLNCTNSNKGFIEGAKYVVTWALGHLVTLAEPEDYNKQYKEWRLEDLPLMPPVLKLKVIKQTAAQYQTVTKLMNRNDISELIIATDAGREGELVARWIMELAKWRKPFKRLWISSQTDAAIREGFAKLRPGTAYNNLYAAAVCRAEADWLVGLNVTRALTCKYNAQLSAGRVQTPTLAMIVDREQTIDKFVPQPYWTVRAQFGDYFGDWRDEGGNSRIFDYDRAAKIASSVTNARGTITTMTAKTKTEPPPLAYNLTELQRDANKRFGFSAHKTLSVLQGLYERHKVVTYPRTDSRYISTDIVPTLPARLRSCNGAAYAALVEPLLAKPLTAGKHFVNNAKVSDHHAIIPTEQPLKLTALTTDERQIYDLVVRRFIAVLYPDYRYRQLTLITTVAAEQFYAVGRVELDRGWRVVTARVVEADEEIVSEQPLSMHQTGEQVGVGSCKITNHKTKPPSRYTEASLLAVMENPAQFIADEQLRAVIKQGGIGTVATRAEIIEKLIQTSYVDRKGKELVPTSKGKQLIGLVAKELKTPVLTAEWEQTLTDIANGTADKAQFMAGIRKYAGRLVQETITSAAAYRADNVTKQKCPLCGKYMLLVNGRRGKQLSCPDRACGHRQPEREIQQSGFKQSKHEQRRSQKLIAEYSDQTPVATNLGDLLKQALTKQD